MLLVAVQMRLGIALVALVTAAVAAVHSSAGAQLRPYEAAASRIVDRTFACAPIVYGGIGDSTSA